MKGGCQMKKERTNPKNEKLEPEIDVTNLQENPVKEIKPSKQRKRPKYSKKYFRKMIGKRKKAFYEFIQADYQMAIARGEQLSSLESKDYDQAIVLTVPEPFYPGSRVNYRLDRTDNNNYKQIHDQALVTILYFGEDHLHYYQSQIDHRTGHIANDVSGEVNYFDVVHIQTYLNYDHIEKPKHLILDLFLGLSDGTDVTFHLRNHQLFEGYELEGLLTPTEQSILDLIKLKVRQAKQI